jgi:hypothetical protein
MRRLLEHLEMDRPPMHLITSLESKLFDMEFMMGKVVLEQIF